jgi:hypothetical protein
MTPQTPRDPNSLNRLTDRTMTARKSRAHQRPS